MAASSDAGFMMSDGPLRTPKGRSFAPTSSSGRPRGPPSENLTAPSDDEGDGFADDQVPTKTNRPGGSQNVPRVEDRVGLVVQEHFENFIEG